MPTSVDAGRPDAHAAEVRRAGIPSIANRIARFLTGWAVVWLVLVSLAMQLVVHREVDQMLDEAMVASSDVMTAMLGSLPVQSLDADVIGSNVLDRVDRRYAWQLVDPDGRVRLRSPGAPAQALHARSVSGFADPPGWRVLGAVLPGSGYMLYVAQSRIERRSELLDVVLGGALATLCVGLLAWFTFRTRLRHELAPLQRLGSRLAEHDPIRLDAGLGPAERAELLPVHQAIDAMGHRLARRMAQERVFSAHAAHALRTPLAGMDVQLALALREAPESLRPRLNRVREAGSRLQRVVAALLLLFRADGVDGAELRWQTQDLAALLARWPIEGLDVRIEPGLQLRADADLLAAAMLNLLDNALRHGGGQVRVQAIAPDCLRIADDGPGIGHEQRERLRQALARTVDAGTAARPVDDRTSNPSQGQAEGTGLGLQMAQLVARAHRGELRLPEVKHGFAVDLCWDMQAQPVTPAGA
ncbi:sensor histidine kinase [Leptothrix discophora]|uniref:histidine kinase n=1 Tax=Leptothrix discophora TaxID=89 RepID=A0ABT9FZB9_LEPDI|nr:HAMP domain-containing sensor histidine kinase [Leptothrix discophora]MDP4299569.1 HAMP domain-containing sensor histidine kinase [Leptothrix discophora]